MATFSLGNVVSPIAQQARLQALAGPQVNPLDALIQGFTQGQALQQLPVQQAQQALMAQLQAELLREKLLDVRDPNRAITREINRQLGLKAIDPASGIVRSIPGFENEIIATPQALPSGTQRVVDVGGDLTPFIGMSPPGTPITPIIGLGGQPTGFAQDFTLPQAIESRKAQEAVKKNEAEQYTKNRFELEQIAAKNKVELEQIKAKADAAGFKGYVNPSDPTDVVYKTRTELPPAGYMEVGNYLKSVKDSKSGGGGDLKPTGETQEKFLGAVNVLGQTDELLKEVEKYKKQGNFPGYSQTAINQFLTQRPQDIPGAGLVPGLSSLYAASQRAVREAQSPEAINIQMRRAVITATILRTQAGLSQTLGETVNITPYTPVESDTYESLVAKLEGIQREGRRSISSYRQLYPQLRGFKIPGLDDGQQSEQTSNNTSFTAPTIQEAEAAARKAGFKKDSIVILNGVPGRLD